MWDLNLKIYIPANFYLEKKKKTVKEKNISLTISSSA